MSTVLDQLAADLRYEETVISPHVRDTDEPPLFGELAAAGPRTSAAPGEYALVVESVREGYLLHYGEPRLLEGADDDLALLAGDYLYALGLRRVAMLADLAAIRELTDLISLTATLHPDGDPIDASAADALWLATAVAVAAGGGDSHERGKRALRDGSPEAAAALWEAARAGAADEAMADRLGATVEAIGFAPPIPD